MSWYFVLSIISILLSLLAIAFSGNTHKTTDKVIKEQIKFNDLTISLLENMESRILQLKKEVEKHSKEIDELKQKIKEL